MINAIVCGNDQVGSDTTTNNNNNNIQKSSQSTPKSGSDDGVDTRVELIKTIAKSYYSNHKYTHPSPPPCINPSPPLLLGGIVITLD